MWVVLGKYMCYFPNIIFIYIILEIMLDKNLLQRGGKETFHPTMQEKFRISFPREAE